MSRSLAEREPTLEWASRSADGQLDGLDWADTDLDPTGVPFSQRLTAGGEIAFRHLPYTAFLPPPIAEAALDAQRRGQATLHEALLLVFARIEWVIASRDFLWSPLSPVPLVLAHLAEAFGVGEELHRGRPAALARLTAILPRWHPRRGSVERALEVIQAVEAEDDEPLCVAYLDEDGEDPDFPSLRDEVLRCRDAEWWRRRQQEGAEARYEVADGLLRFQPAKGPAFVMQKEDVLLEWDPERSLPRNLMRLLPAWAELRLASTRSS